MDFLRSSDTDIKSALHTLIGPPPETIPPSNLESVVNLTPPSNLGLPSKLDSDLNTGPGISMTPPVNLSEGVGEAIPILTASQSATSIEDLNLKTIRPAKIIPPSKLEPGLKLTSATILDGRQTKKRNFTIREATTAADGHSRAEHGVYEALWREGTAQFDGTRLITIGMLALARLCGLSESNARINLRSLQRKLAVEEHSTFVCENSLGRTWRVFSPEQILKRRRAAGLNWYMKRTLAVVFVDPQTGSQLNKGS